MHPRLRAAAVMCWGVLSGCPGANHVTCLDDTNCDRFSGGVCQPAPSGSTWCSYPDSECSSGQRYSELDVGDGLAGQCVPESSEDAGVDVSADWVTRFGGLLEDSGTAIAIAPNGDLVMAGSFQNTMSFGGDSLSSAGDTDAWVTRFRPNGRHVWSARLGGAGADGAVAVAVDATGDVYVRGGYRGPVDFGGGTRNSPYGGFLVKLSGMTGAYQWDQAPPVSPYGGGVAVTAANVVVAASQFNGTIDFGGGNITSTPAAGFDCALAAYDGASGVHRWSMPMATTGNDGEDCNVVAVSEDVIAVGAFFGTAMLGGAPLTSAGNMDLFLARYRGSDGGHVWSMRRGGVDLEHASAIASNGTHVLVGGYFLNRTNLGGSDVTGAGSYDGFLASYNAVDGTYVWSHAFGSNGNERLISIASTADKLAVGIGYSGSLRIGTQTFELSQSSTNIADVAIVRMNPATGAPTAAVSWGGSASGAENMSLAQTRDRLVGVGTFEGVASLFDSMLVSEGDKDIATFSAEF